MSSADAPLPAWMIESTHPVERPELWRELAAATLVAACRENDHPALLPATLHYLAAGDQGVAGAVLEGAVRILRGLRPRSCPLHRRGLLLQEMALTLNPEARTALVQAALMELREVLR